MSSKVFACLVERGSEDVGVFLFEVESRPETNSVIADSSTLNAMCFQILDDGVPLANVSAVEGLEGAKAPRVLNKLRMLLS